MLTSYSFVPAESATLGLVDKSLVFVTSNAEVLTYDQFLLVFKRANRSLRSDLWTMPEVP